MNAIQTLAVVISSCAVIVYVVNFIIKGSLIIGSHKTIEAMKSSSEPIELVKIKKYKVIKKEYCKRML